MADRYASVKVRESTIKLIKEAKKVFLKHHPHMDGMTITRNLIIKRALAYYIEN